MKTALIIGATGLVGSNCVKQLLDDERYERVKVFTRKTFGLTHPKLEEYIVNFEQIELWKNNIRGDELFSAMGTTIKTAGSKAAQYKVDFTYQYNFAKAASENGVETYLLVSSAGANAHSRNFYLKMKGELDDKVKDLAFQKTYIFRPSILSGDRAEKRLGEAIGIQLMKYLTRFILPIRKYRPIEVETVAKAMIKAANSKSVVKLSIYELDQIFDF